jgi:hypothetical protein
MKLGEYLQHDAVGLAECVARGEIGAGELLTRQRAICAVHAAGATRQPKGGRGSGFRHCWMAKTNDRAVRKSS